MDIASLLGLLLGSISMTVVLWMTSHGHFMMFFSGEGVLMVGCGSVSVVLMAMPMDKLLQVPRYIRRFMFNTGHKQAQVVRFVEELADIARRDGMLSIESQMARAQAFDPFLAGGLRMAIDGQDPHVVENNLRSELMAMQDRHKAGKKFFDLIKVYGPGWALVGTLIGQIGMFGNLEGAEVGQLGHHLAVAVCATMYGTLIANAVAGPIGDKLAMRSSEEMLNREMMLQGVLSIQAGDNPRLTYEKMLTFIPPRGRATLATAA